ncbi:unnamed protein product [Chilo suppressalis]|uniref:Uncharacterized protein n=1 Tax=Chilo suppressalis TaxID=168631 RepID=A0ABN8B4F7_CHISP|nr:unnamed protein product [Chilo suppressalis]
MRCCVPGCKNDSRYSSKSQGITFHVFPNEPSLRAIWLEALGKKETWEPKGRSSVCSEHFLSSDMSVTRHGLRKIRSGAVPIILQDTSNCEYWETAASKVCRICLVMAKKLFPIKTHTFETAYEHLTGQSISAETRLPQQLCAECTQRLQNCNNFRIKSLRANTLMMGLLKKHDHLTIKNIQSINRENNQLSSNLTTSTRIDHFDLLIIEDNQSEADYLENDQLNEDFKSEEQLLKEDFSIPAPDVVTDNNEESDYDPAPEEENSNHEDFDNTKDLDYSSDDRLPLEVTELKSRGGGKTKKACVRKRKNTEIIIPDTPKVDRRRKPFLNDDLNETLFTITDLTVEEQIADIEKRRDSFNFKNSIYKCLECYKGFLDKDAYNSHMSRHTTECGDHRCNICKTHFKHPNALRKHITAHHTKRFSCNQCLYVTTSRLSARLHVRWHKGIKYKCPHCTDEFLKLTTYLGHIRIKHPSDFVCQLCGYSFVSEKGIMLHKNLKHRQENTTIPEDGPLCELCNLRFINTEALKRHTSVSARHQTTDKQDREPNTPKQRKREIRRTRIGASIPCEQCGVQLQDYTAYHSHFRRMHPDKNRTKFPSIRTPLMCEVCGRMFQNQTLLEDHRWVHTDERPFSCESCDKCFRTKNRLVAHRLIHSDQKPTYPCVLCGKHFSTRSNRHRHMFIHTGQKPFKCEMCGKGFKNASEKRTHISYVHLKKPWPKRNRGKRRTDGRQEATVDDEEVEFEDEEEIDNSN